MQFSRDHETLPFKPIKVTFIIDNAAEANALVKCSASTKEICQLLTTAGHSDEHVEIFSSFLAKVHYWSR